MDDSTVLLLGLGATAVAGFVALQMASAESGPAPAPKKKSKRRSKKRVEEVEEVEATPEEAAPEAASPKSTKKKRRHKGRKKKKSASKKNSERVIDETLATTYEDDGSNKDAWSKVQAPKKVTKKPEKSSDDAEESAPKKASLPTFTMDLGNRVSSVIGRGGSKIRSIQEESGAKLDIERDSSTLTIRGTLEQIEIAKGMVTEAIADRGPSRPTYSCTALIDLGSKAGRVIGPRGATIQGIQDSTGCFLDIKRQDDGTAEALIKGPDDESVAAAQAQVEEILAGASDRGGRGGGNSVTMDLGSRQGKFAILGKGGSQIMELQRTSGAHLSIGKEDNVVTISGTDEQIKEAQGLISAVLAKFSSQQQIQLTQETVGAVIGKGGSTIRRIERETDASLRINRDEMTLNIIGTSSAVAAAVALVNEVMSAPRGRSRSALKEGEVEEIVELGNAVGSIIGKGGSNIQKLQAESGAKLDIERGTSKCRITGLPAAVAQAKEAVEATIAKNKEYEEKRAARRAQANAPEADASNMSKGDTGDGDGDWSAGPEGW